MIDVVATERHYIDHLAPVWHALPAHHRGTFWTRPETAAAAKARAGDQVRVFAHNLPPSDRLTVVCSQATMNAATKARRRTVVAQHGAGQTYTNADGSIARGGGDVFQPWQEQHIAAHLVPGEYQRARRLELAGDRVPVFAVGCPKLGPWHHTRPTRAGLVVVSSHWDNRDHPETRRALPHFEPALPGLAAKFNVAGHGHPRAEGSNRRAFARAGIGYLADFAAVLERAAVYVADNTSTLFEFAATGRPVVMLNAPWYRRDHRHGLRFWDYAGVGYQCDGPDGLADVVGEALRAGQTAGQAGLVADLYACRGWSAQRVANLLIDLS